MLSTRSTLWRRSPEERPSTPRATMRSRSCWVGSFRSRRSPRSPFAAIENHVHVIGKGFAAHRIAKLVRHTGFCSPSVACRSHPTDPQPQPRLLSSAVALAALAFNTAHREQRARPERATQSMASRDGDGRALRSSHPPFRLAAGPPRVTSDSHPHPQAPRLARYQASRRAQQTCTAPATQVRAFRLVRSSQIVGRASAMGARALLRSRAPLPAPTHLLLVTPRRLQGEVVALRQPRSALHTMF